ncbi:hypothetical protein F2P56_007968 [Juglans regia]|uniref:Uncharacterized protein n=1 Tax=Juglans regia TaxID=51240 RepID=A0A833Y6C0_JUGRE|nr:hypothetical protein F2P56_007968 [Juglans regia]
MVYARVLRTTVKILQPTSSTDANLEASLPWKSWGFCFVDMLMKSPTSHEIVDRELSHLHILVFAISDQRHEMDVAELGEQLDFLILFLVYIACFLFINIVRE